ncbi:MAG: helix-hairpin-helix domain-containing protein [Anaerolineae bacterium]
MKNKLSAIFYLGLGFAVGYLLDTLRRNSPPAPVDQDLFVDPSESVLNAIDDVSANLEMIEAKPEIKIEEKEQASAEFLQAINGIGPAYAKRIFASGIRSFEQLVELSPEELLKSSKARSQDQVEAWLMQAAELLNK